ncbi:MAG: biotin--[acetyl-CoA-carboxylase] ligase [Candidatus Melainabacteria bacterium]|nr:MAG: biotin--[acetyl-CoA-carboxylase] ligase [Candidatus Melainabacteria bacterium]
MIKKYLSEVNSTNTYAKEHIKNIKDKTVIYTSHQTGGRGRFNRVWVDLGDENLFLSFVLKPSKDLKPVYSNLTQYTALKLAKTFEQYGVSPKIKWPNDILIDGKKISGILAESVMSEGILKGLIIGVGLNLNANKEDFAQIDKVVTALNLEIKKDVDKKIFLNKFCKNFFNDYENFLEHGFISIKSEYEYYANFIGKEVTIKNFSTTLKGIAEKITDEGAIVVDGQEFLTGDII